MIPLVLPALVQKLLPYAAVALLTVGILGVTYTAGKRSERAVWQARDAEIQRQVAAERLVDQKRLATLTAEVETLRNRPEQIRTVIKEVIRHVKSDKVCPSLPADWRDLWMREPGTVDRPPAGPAAVDDAGAPGVAPDRVD